MIDWVNQSFSLLSSLLDGEDPAGDFVAGDIPDGTPLHQDVLGIRSMTELGHAHLFDLVDVVHVVDRIRSPLRLDSEGFGKLLDFPGVCGDGPEPLETRAGQNEPSEIRESPNGRLKLFG